MVWTESGAHAAHDPQQVYIDLCLASIASDLQPSRVSDYCVFADEFDASLQEKKNEPNRLRNRLVYIYKDHRVQFQSNDA